MAVFTDFLASFGWVQLLALWLVVIFAAVMRAFTGFGFALVAVPIFSLMMLPTEAVVLSVSLTLAVSLNTFSSYWGKYPLSPLVPLLVLAVIGTALGAALLTVISVQQFQLWIGLLVILASLMLVLYKPRLVRPSNRLAAFAGLGSGLMNGAFAMPGPPVIVYAMAVEPEPARSRALLMTYFLFSALTGLASFAVAGFIDPFSPLLFLLAYPAMSVGDKIGFLLFHRYGSGFYRRVALLVLFAVGISIIVRAILHAYPGG